MKSGQRNKVSWWKSSGVTASLPAPPPDPEAFKLAVDLRKKCRKVDRLNKVDETNAKFLPAVWLKAGSRRCSK
jgi:hypothetical protein